MGGHKGPTAAANTKSMRGQLGLRSGPLAPTSAKLTTQYLVMDHMKNHYSKITKAKPAIDNGLPKSMSTSQKMRDRKTRDFVQKKGYRPTSGMSVNYPVRPYSQMTYAEDDEDYYDEAQWGEPEDEEDRLAREIMRTTLRPHTSRPYGSTNATYGSETDPNQTYQQSPYYSSQLDHSQAVPRAYSQRPHSARSSARSVTSTMSRSALPNKTSIGAKKTYDGDVLDKRSHVFTQPEKPFTPRLLKSNRKSRLSETKHYTAPPKKGGKPGEKSDDTYVKQVDEKAQNMSPTPKPRAKPRVVNNTMSKSGELTETLMFESLQSRDFSNYNDREQLVPRLDISLDKDHMNWIQEQASKAEIRAKSGTLQSSMSKIKEGEMMETTNNFNDTQGNLTATGTLSKTNRAFGTHSFNSSQKLSSDYMTRGKSSALSAVEEELKYVEFIKEVTDDVLNRGIFTNRVLRQVFETHIAKRRGQLNETRMRSMVDKVREDLGIPEHDDDSELAEYTPQNTTLSSESSKLRSTGASRYGKFDHGKVTDHTFGSTMESQNTYNFKDTSSGDLFSTIHSEREDELSATQALKDYQLGITKHEEEEEDHKSYESPGEIKPDTDEEKEGSLTETRKMTGQDREDVQSTHSTAKHSESRFSQKSRQSEVRSKPSPRPRTTAPVQEDDITESTTGHSTVRSRDDDDGYEEDEFEESDDERHGNDKNQISDEDF